MNLKLQKKGWLGEIIHNASAHVLAFHYWEHRALSEYSESVVHEAIDLLANRLRELEDEAASRSEK